MKETSEEILRNYIINHQLNTKVTESKDNEFTYMDLYKLYSSLEIKSLRDLALSPSDFCDFLDNNIGLFNNNQDQIDDLSDIFRRARLRIKYISNARRYRKQRIFANIVSDLAPSKNNTTILDVGAGLVPYSSIYMGKKMKKVFSMDNNFVLSKDSLEAMNVTPKNSYFEETTPVTEYDFVVGRFPCSAIEQIVRQCSKNNKPYFVELCECEMPHRTHEDGTALSWQEILSEIDPKLQYTEDYVFNLDATKRQVRKTINHVNEVFDIVHPSSSNNITNLIEDCQGNIENKTETTFENC